MSWFLLALVYFGTPYFLDFLGGLSWARVFGGPGYVVYFDGEMEPQPLDTLPKMWMGVLMALGAHHWLIGRLPATGWVRRGVAELTWPLWLDMRVESYRRVRDGNIEDLDFGGKNS